MNWHKMRGILELIRERGRLPTDPTGEVLSDDDLVAWLGLDTVLDPAEIRQIKKELRAMVETEAAIARAKLGAS